VVEIHQFLRKIPSKVGRRQSIQKLPKVDLAKGIMVVDLKRTDVV
jgi:hypothetical protein